jgi:pentatricopeptide repeat protein
VFGLEGVVPSPKFVNMLMASLLKFRRPHKAVEAYDRAVAVAGFGPTLEVATTLARALTPSTAEAKRIAKEVQKQQQQQPMEEGRRSSTSTTTAATRTDTLKGSSLSPKRTDRLMAATVLLEKRGVVADTFFLNTLMRCLMLNGQVAEAEDVFYRVMKAGGTSLREEKARPAPPDRFSWNIMIDSYARLGRADLAAKCFQDMSQAAVSASASASSSSSLQASSAILRPDLFTCTALMKAFAAVDDFARADDLLSTMEAGLSIERQGAAAAEKTAPTTTGGMNDGFFASIARVAPDVRVYNTLLAAYCRCLRWREAEELLLRISEVAGLEPTYDSFAHLVPCLCRAGHPSLGLSKLEQVRDLGIHLDTKLYTMFIVCHARLKDPVGALQLLQEMKTHGMRPSLQTFTAVMDACLRAGNPDLCLALVAELKRAGAEPDEVVYTMIVRAYGLKNEVRKAALLVAALQREATAAATTTTTTSTTTTARPSLSSSKTKKKKAVLVPGPALYNTLLREAVMSESWAIALGALEEVLLIARPSDATYFALAAGPEEREYSLLSPRLVNTNIGFPLDEEAPSALRAKFLFEAVNRIKNSPKEGIRIAGEL